MNTKPHIEAVIPVFNEVNCIPLLIDQLDKAKASISSEATFSYLFINDGSTDGTTELLRNLNSQRPDIRVVELLHNFGHAAALACGLDHFKGDAALFMDADLQDPPSALAALFYEWKNGNRTVVVERGKRAEKNSFLFQTFYLLLRKASKTLPPINFGTHSLLDRTVVERMRIHKERNRYFPGLVALCSGPIAAINLPRGERAYGKSRVGFGGLAHLALTAFLSFSSAPIRLVSLLGFVCSGGALIGASIIVAVKLLTDWAIPGWASTMSLLFFASGIQLLCLGILGEYVARIYDEVKERPLYWVGTILPAQHSPSQSHSIGSASRSSFIRPV
jgi:glycosyltransferase involved in cell wall biosynthesis